MGGCSAKKSVLSKRDFQNLALYCLVMKTWDIFCTVSVFCDSVMPFIYCRPKDKIKPQNRNLIHLKLAAAGRLGAIKKIFRG